MSSNGVMEIRGPAVTYVPVYQEDEQGERTLHKVEVGPTGLNEALKTYSMKPGIWPKVLYNLTQWFTLFFDAFKSPVFEVRQFAKEIKVLSGFCAIFEANGAFFDSIREVNKLIKRGISWTGVDKTFKAMLKTVYKTAEVLLALAEKGVLLASQGAIYVMKALKSGGSLFFDIVHLREAFGLMDRRHNTPEEESSANWKAANSIAGIAFHGVIFVGGILAATLAPVPVLLFGTTFMLSGIGSHLKERKVIDRVSVEGASAINMSLSEMKKKVISPPSV